MMDFTPPLRATNHCRHYSYVVPITRPDAGPKCAAGCSFDEPGSTGRCMPEATKPCNAREEYTETERLAWAAARDDSMIRLSQAVCALPEAIPLRSGGYVACPNCDGKIRYDRWHRGAELNCSTPFCCSARFKIAAGAE